ncbi:M48 family metalloprotease [Piscinibacter defluvii]|uniref:M48 family metalloprotease n=1 Tax=Piscinibacter defluvii TaxID=1796922 RepID=UPI001F0C56A7|nr:M48 family metalloprotease [Piscinibacter defluvii]
MTPAASRFRRRVVAACAAALLATSWPAHAQVNLPALGDSANEDFAVSTERRVGEQIMREIRRDPDYLDDPLLLEYLRTLWSPLVAQARANGSITPDIDPRFAWEAFLVRDRSVNAFALPGGYVGVHLGLIAITATRDELASVLAHELTHVTQRHIARSITNSKRQSLIGLAAMIIGVIAAARSRNTDGANAAIMGGQAAAIQGQLNFSRDMEREADRIGFQVMTGAGFAPWGMAAMFEKLDHAARLNDNGSYPYLRTHPLTSERIGEARARMGTEAAGALDRLPGTGNLLEHALAQARAQVLMDMRVDALRRAQSLEAPRADASPAQRLADHYASALASLLLKEPARVDTALGRAEAVLANSPRQEPRAQRQLAFLRAQLQLGRGDARAALATLAPYTGDGSRAGALALAEVALALPADDPAVKRSADELQTRVAGQPGDATSWTLLSRLWGRLDQPLRALRAEGEAQYALGDLPGALDRWRAGQRLARGGGNRPADFIEASVIDARVRDVQAQLRALAIEQGRPPPQ